jgi:hypothetical protein
LSQSAWISGGGPLPESCHAVGTRVNRQEHREGDHRAQGLPEPGDRYESARRGRDGERGVSRAGPRDVKGLLALAVGAGLQVMAAIMEEEVTAKCGPKGRHDPERTAVRHGHGAGSVTLGGRRVPVVRPRMCAVDGSSEIAVPAYELFSDTELPRARRAQRCLATVTRVTFFSSRRPRPPWPSCWPRTCLRWTWWR